MAADYGFSSSTYSNQSEKATRDAPDALYMAIGADARRRTHPQSIDINYPSEQDRSSAYIHRRETRPSITWNVAATARFYNGAREASADGRVTSASCRGRSRARSGSQILVCSRCSQTAAASYSGGGSAATPGASGSPGEAATECFTSRASS